MAKEEDCSSWTCPEERKTARPPQLSQSRDSVGGELGFFFLNTRTIAISGPAWSSRSSKSLPMMSPSKSWLLSSSECGLLFRQPFIKVFTARGAGEGEDTGRDNDSKPGGSDGGIDGMLLGRRSSSTAVTGVGTATLLTSINSGTSGEHTRKKQK